MKRTSTLVSAAAAGLLTIVCATDASAFARGDVFASVGGGHVNRYDGAGHFIETLDTGVGGFTTGCGFDADTHLYVTNFGAGSVSEFDDDGKLIGVFGSGYSGSPESILFDGKGDAYVGAVNGDNDIRKFDANGTPLAKFDVAIDDRGSDWIELASDQCTMFYTSEGKKILRYDVCQDKQLADFVTNLPGSAAFALRLLPNGEILVADSAAIHRLDSNGTILQTYDAPNQDAWFALNIAPGGSSFWSGDSTTGNFFNFDIASGQVLVGPVNTGSSEFFGLCVLGEVTAASESICDDGQDNDGDSKIDCHDEDCASAPNCMKEVEVMCGQEATIVGTNGDDVIQGTPGRDIIHGRKGNDLIRGHGGNDVLCGGMGNDTLLGGAGRDVLHGGSGKDVLRGGKGPDTLNGGPGAGDQCIDVPTSVFSPECEN